MANSNTSVNVRNATAAPAGNRSRSRLPALASPALLLLAASAAANAPETFTAAFGTTTGLTLRVNVTRALAPLAADRLHALLSAGYYDDNGFLRIEESAARGPFVVQFGVASSPAVAAAWAGSFPDEPVRASNVRGAVAFAADERVPNSRSTMIFVNLADNAFLDAKGFAPFGVLADDESWAAVAALNRAYMESIYIPMAFGMGSEWLRAEYPGLSFTTTAIAEGAVVGAADADADADAAAEEGAWLSSSPESATSTCGIVSGCGRKRVSGGRDCRR